MPMHPKTLCNEHITRPQYAASMTMLHFTSGIACSKSKNHINFAQNVPNIPKPKWLGIKTIAQCYAKWRFGMLSTSSTTS